MRNFYLLRSVDPGFSPQNILTMRLWLPDSRYDEPAKIAAAYRDVLERLETIRGVESSSAVLGVPLSGMSANFGITVEGRPEPLPAKSSQPASNRWRQVISARWGSRSCAGAISR